MVGSGALRLTLRDGSVREAVRYTLSAAPAFQAAARVLEAYAKEEEPSDSLLADFDTKKACGKCGDPLPDDTNVCPKCVDRKAVLLRLLSYAVPYKVRVDYYHAADAGRHRRGPSPADLPAIPAG